MENDKAPKRVGSAWTGGQPSEDSPRRCLGTSRLTGEQCKRWALRGVTRCQRHGGRMQQKAQQGHGRVEYMPGWYRDALGPTIAEALDKLTCGSASEQLQLFEELALMRHAAQDAVKLYAAAQRVTGDNALSVRTEAAAIMQAQLREVAKICESAARVDAMAKDKFSIHAVQLLINQMVRICAQVFKDHEDLVKTFERRIREEVKLPTSDAVGTSITPDAEVREMDSTVPLFVKDKYDEGFEVHDDGSDAAGEQSVCE